jgi:hypothetical protein
VTWSVPHFWNLCFLLCAVCLAGWMFLYTGQLRIGGGVVFYHSNVLLLLSLILAVLVSSVVRFGGHQKYIAILALCLALAAFHIAVPVITSPSTLLRLLKNERVTRDGANSLLTHLPYKYRAKTPRVRLSRLPGSSSRWQVTPHLALDGVKWKVNENPIRFTRTL